MRRNAEGRRIWGGKGEPVSLSETKGKKLGGRGDERISKRSEEEEEENWKEKGLDFES